MFMNSGHKFLARARTWCPWAVPYLCLVIPAGTGVRPGTHYLQEKVEREVRRGRTEQGGRARCGNRVKKRQFLVQDE